MTYALREVRDLDVARAVRRSDRVAATTIAGRTAYGILGVLVVILIGPTMLLPVKPG